MGRKKENLLADYQHVANKLNEEKDFYNKNAPHKKVVSKPRVSKISILILLIALLLLCVEVSLFIQRTNQVTNNIEIIRPTTLVEKTIIKEEKLEASAFVICVETPGSNIMQCPKGENK